MIKIFPFSKLGNKNYGWLNAHYHFSFSEYYNPDRTGFGKLLVINDDIVSPGRGFPTHSHRDMEIITYVRKGAITHKDNLGNEGKTEAGDVQVMSAGKGIAHSEYNYEDVETNLYQIWIEPNKVGLEPRWDTKKFPKKQVSEKLELLVSNSLDAPLYINQNAKIYAGNILKGSKIEHEIENQAYILCSEGQFEVNGNLMCKGDGAEVKDDNKIIIEAKTDCEILVIDVVA